MGYLPDVQAHGLVVPAWVARRAQPWSLQDGHVYLAGLADPQPELGVAGEAAVVPAASRRLALDPGPGQLLSVAQRPSWVATPTSAAGTGSPSCSLHEQGPPTLPPGPPGQVGVQPPLRPEEKPRGNQDPAGRRGACLAPGFRGQSSGPLRAHEASPRAQAPLPEQRLCRWPASEMGKPMVTSSNSRRNSSSSTQNSPSWSCDSSSDWAADSTRFHPSPLEGTSLQPRPPAC